MVFSVRFRRQNSLVVDKKSYQVGFRLIDWVRQELGLPYLSIDLFHDYVMSYRIDELHIEIDEDIARRSDCFQEINTLNVDVPANFFNRYVIEQLNTVKHECNGEITIVHISQVCDKEKIIKAWEAAGFPGRWGLNSSESEEYDSE